MPIAVSRAESDDIISALPAAAACKRSTAPISIQCIQPGNLI